MALVILRCVFLMVAIALGFNDGYALGQDLRGTKVFAEMQKGTNSRFEAADASSGEMRLQTVRKVAGHPLWVGVSADLDGAEKSAARGRTFPSTFAVGCLAGRRSARVAFVA